MSLRKADKEQTARHSMPPFSLTVPTAILATGVIGGLVLCYLIAVPFIPAIVWSTTLALLFIPLQVRLEKILDRPNIAAGLSVLVAAVIVVVPVIMVSTILLREAIQGSAKMAETLGSGAWSNLLSHNPAMAAFVDWIGGWLNVAKFLENLQVSLAAWSGRLIEGSLTGLITLLITFFFLFYLLRDRDIVREALRNMFPFSANEFAILHGRLVDTVFASVYGTLTVAALQGTLGGLMFWWLGLPSPVFWGVLMGLLAIVPFLGAFVIWVPAAVVLVLSGDFVAGIILTIWGTIIVGLIDNIVYPVLVGRRLRLHSAVSFLAIMGGLVLFGPSGIVLGPIIVAVTQSMIVILRERLDQQDEFANQSQTEASNLARS